MSPRLAPCRRRAVAAVAVAIAVALLVACGDSGTLVADGAYQKDTGVPTLSIPAPPTTLADAKGKPCKAATDVPEAEGKPEVEMPEGKPPDTLTTDDIEVGDGEMAKVGDSVKVHYVGIACSTGVQFDSSWDAGEPFEVALQVANEENGGQGVIGGWVYGINGMQVGGRRRLIIPPDVAYGAEGRDGIAPNETLVFVVDLEDVTPPSETTTTTAPAGTDGTVTTTAPEGTDESSTTTEADGPTTAPDTTTTTTG